MKRVVLVLILAGALLLSCKKNDTGGDATIVAFPKHHGKAIKGATAYVKFKAEELPSDPTNNYDLKIQGNPNEDHIHIEGLRYGKYFLYVLGYDSAANPPIVKGGLPVKIKWSDRKEEINIDVAVTE